MNLSKQLMAIADYVPLNALIADIGTDHGYLPCYLVQSKKCAKVIACDVNSKPLEVCAKNVREYGLNEQIDIRLADGLKGLKPKEVDVATISGMGASLMIDILEQSPEIYSHLKRIILQPNLAAHLIRLWAMRHHFKIVDEALLLEDKRYYEIIVLEPGEMVIDNTMTFIGPVLLAKKHPLLKAYLDFEQQKDKEILAKLAQSQSDAAGEKMAFLKEKWQKINEVISREY